MGFTSLWIALNFSIFGGILVTGVQADGTPAGTIVGGVFGGLAALGTLYYLIVYLCARHSGGAAVAPTTVTTGRTSNQEDNTAAAVWKAQNS